MRTTINIEDDIFQIVRSLSKDSEQPLGKVVSDLLRKALKPHKPLELDTPGALPSFQVSDCAPMIPSRRAGELLDEED